MLLTVVVVSCLPITVCLHVLLTMCRQQQLMGMAGRQQVRRGMTPYSKLVVRSNPPLPLQVRLLDFLVTLLVVYHVSARSNSRCSAGHVE